jgi:hypothetical protein
MCNLMDQSFIYNVFFGIYAGYQVTTWNRHGAKNVVSKKAKYLDIFPAGDTYTHMWICYVCERCSAIYGSSVGGKCALDVQSGT